MKKNFTNVLILLIMSILFCGCGHGKKGTEEATNIDNTISELDASSILALDQGDNSLDAYSMSINVLLKVEKPENALLGGGQKWFLGISKAFYFKKHLFEDYLKCWDEIASVSMTGEMASEAWNHEHQIWDVGAVIGTNHYLVYDFEYEEGRFSYYIKEFDENNTILREIPLSFLESTEVEFINYLVMDAKGWIHFVRNIGEETHYMVVSSEGELVIDYSPDDYSIQELVPLYNGDIACVAMKRYELGEKQTETELQLQYIDIKTGESNLLVTRNNPFGQEDFWVTMWDADSLLCANSQGIYKSDLNGENAEFLYKWMNHGISASGVLAMQLLPEEQIALIYESYGEPYYLCIEPTTQQVEVLEIVLAVSPAMEEIYKPVVTEFNKKHPACHIELRSNLDETVLLTELIAGEGPVLIDTSLTGFESQKELWEPLDNVLEELDIANELEASALELGRIDGTLYGVVTNFWLETLVTRDDKLQDWNYDSFLMSIEKQPILEAIVNSEYLEDDALRFVSNFLVHGLEDNYFFDIETYKPNIDNDEFRKMLRYIKKYCVRSDFVNPGRTSLEGNVLCNSLKINRPEQVALYRICYGDNINYIGFPGKEGADNYLNSFSPISIRITASKEEKAIAYAFLRLLLSYDCQVKLAKESNFSLSIRKDVLEEQINAVNEETLVYAMGFESMILGDEVDNQKDGKILRDIINHAKPKRTFPEELNTILTEELQQYFSDAITEDVVIQRLENRIGLYLDESK